PFGSAKGESVPPASLICLSRSRRRRATAETSPFVSLRSVTGRSTVLKSRHDELPCRKHIPARPVPGIHRYRRSAGYSPAVPMRDRHLCPGKQPASLLRTHINKIDPNRGILRPHFLLPEEARKGPGER